MEWGSGRRWLCASTTGHLWFRPSVAGGLGSSSLGGEWPPSPPGLCGAAEELSLTQSLLRQCALCPCVPSYSLVVTNRSWTLCGTHVRVQPVQELWAKLCHPLPSPCLQLALFISELVRKSFLCSQPPCVSLQLPRDGEASPSSLGCSWAVRPPWPPTPVAPWQTGLGAGSNPGWALWVLGNSGGPDWQHRVSPPHVSPASYRRRL